MHLAYFHFLSKFVLDSTIVIVIPFFSSEDRIRNGAKKLMKSKQGATQGRMDSFFKAVPSPMTDNKRKVCSKIVTPLHQ